MKRILKTVIVFALFSMLLYGGWGGEYEYNIDYKQDMYDSFGSLIGRDMRIAYEYSAITSVGGGSDIGFSLRKARDLFWQRLKGFVALTETLGWNIVMEYTFQEKGRQISWSPQMLDNNTLDGFYVTFKRGGIIGLDLLNSFPLDFVHIPESDYEQTRAEQADPEGYTTLEDEEAIPLFQGFRLYTFEETFPQVMRGAITYFKVNRLEAFGLTMNKSSVSSKSQFYKGAYNKANVPEEGLHSFYIRVVCLNQNRTNQSDSNYAALYGVSSTNVNITIEEEIPPVEKAIDNDGNIYYKINPGEFAVYKVSSSDTNILEEMKAYVAIANSYAIQVAAAETADGQKVDVEVAFPTYDAEAALNSLPYVTVAYSENARPDHGNYKVVEVQFGVPTANNFLGFHADLVLLTLDINLSLFKNFRFFQFPSDNGEYAKMDATSIDVKVGRSFFWFRADYNFYFTDVAYDSRFITYGTNYNTPLHVHYGVLDNDDDDLMTPLYNTYYWEADELYEGQGTDMNNNNEPDFTEDVLLIAEDAFFFRIGADNNNNGVPDKYEDDNNLDYDVMPNMLGHKANFKYQSDFGLDAEFFFVHEKNLTQGLTNFTIGGVLKYLYSRRSFGYLNARYEFKRVKDRIPDDISPIEGVSDGVDDLNFTNSFVHTFNTLFSFWAVENMIFEALPALRYNFQRAEDRHLLESGVTFRAKYKIDFGRWVKGLSITPMFKYVYHSYRTIPYSQYFANEKNQTFVTLGEIMYSPTETLAVKAGYQFRLERDLLDSLENWNSHLIMGELSLIQKSIVMLLGFKWQRYNFTDPDRSSYNKSSIYITLLYRS